VIALLLVASLATTVAADDNKYQITFSGTQYLATGETGKVSVGVGSGPAGNYTYTASVSTGKVTPTTGKASGTSLDLIVTAPTTVGDQVLTVNITSADVTPAVSTVATYTIHVIAPVLITATVKNTANVTANNVPVEFYADGNLVNKTTVSVPALGSKQVFYNWTAPNLAQGKHSLEVKVDPNNQFISFSDDSTTYATSFYIGDSGYGLVNTMLTILFVIVALVLFFTYMGRGRKKRAGK
jgi:hypothetical protein